MIDGLPGQGDLDELTELIGAHTGEITTLRPTAGGDNSAGTFLLDCEKGTFFVKAVPNRPGGRRESLIREGLINPHIQPISPALRWQAENHTWVALGFEVVHGRPANFTPGSPDLPVIIDIVNRIGELTLPAIARDWPEDRWDRYATNWAEARLFDGDALLYTDIHPGNLIVGSGSAWAVDWAWPTRGAAFIDPACLVVQLIAAELRPESAESWAARCPAWTNADPRAVNAFAAASRRMHQAAADRHADAAWLRAMTTAAERWEQHRLH